MEDYRSTNRDRSDDSIGSHRRRDEESSRSGSKRPRDEDLERLKSTRSDLFQKHLGYTDENNPFGDEDLTKPFVWEKNEKFKSLDKDCGPESLNVESKLVELKQVKQRRKEYELEKARLIESRLQSSKSQDESYQEWEAKEVEFNLKQIVAKPLMRYKQGRAKLVDKLVLTVDPDFTESFEEAFDTTSLFKKSTPEDVAEAQEILNAYLELNKLPESTEYLENLLVLAKEPAQSNYEMTGVSQAVGDKIDQILSTKSLEELNVFETQIKKRLEGGVVDTNFWETALSRIPFFKACKYVANVLAGKQPTSELKSDSGATASADKGHGGAPGGDEADRKRDSALNEKSKDQKRKGVSYEKFVQYVRLEEDEEVFDEQVNLADNNSNPETPRYFNRVKKGFEWNKYNLAHYDQDHPPPKLVQGYRFNLFFPDLKGKVPKWKLQKDGDSTETVLLRFIAGYPYRDIAFRVVNKEWITDTQKGFKNFFDNGVLHLYFDFKKIKYRR